MAQTPEEKAVIKALGDSGRLVVDLVNSKLTQNAAELRALAEKFNVMLEDALNRRDQDLIEFLQSRIKPSLSDAVTAHREAATAFNDGRGTPEAAEAAEAATAFAQSKFNDWDEWREGVDSDISKLKEDVQTLKDRPTPVPEVPVVIPTVPAPAASEPETKTVKVEVADKPEDGLTQLENIRQEQAAQPVIQKVRVNLNVKTWGGLAWTLAFGFALIGLILVLSIYGVLNPSAPEVLRWIEGALIIAFSFFLGGTIGSYIESKQTVVKQETAG